MMRCGYSLRVSSIRVYISIAPRISESRIYSSGVCDLAESPGPHLTEGHGMSAWSLRVGEPNGSRPIITRRSTIGCCAGIDDGFSRVERGVNVHPGTRARIISRVSVLE